MNFGFSNYIDCLLGFLQNMLLSIYASNVINPLFMSRCKEALTKVIKNVLFTWHGLTVKCSLQEKWSIWCFSCMLGCCPAAFGYYLTMTVPQLTLDSDVAQDLKLEMC